MEYKLSNKGFDTVLLVCAEAGTIGPVEITEEMTKKGKLTTFKAKTAQEVNYIVAGAKELKPSDYELMGGYVMQSLDKKCNLYVHFQTNPSKEVLKQLILGFELGAYEFDKYKQKKNERELSHIMFHPNTEGLADVLAEAFVIADSTNLARELVNEPANMLNPEIYEQIILERYADHPKVTMTVFKGQDLVNSNMNGLIEVGKGSQHEPRLISLAFNNAPEKPLLALVGKGLTFDSGGMNLKTSRYVGDMRSDMGGSATMLGAFDLLVNMDAPVNVVCNLSICENIISKTMVLAGDVISYPNGITVEVGNTDAEGRLVLADALILSQKQGSKHVLDAATLTGAIVAALGDQMAGLFGNDDEAVKALIEAGHNNNENYWHMPIYKDYLDYMKSATADYMNIALTAPGAGATTAALFLELFIEEGTKWMHLDIAGTAMPKKLNYKTNATGFGVRSVAEYVMKQN